VDFREERKTPADRLLGLKEAVGRGSGVVVQKYSGVVVPLWIGKEGQPFLP
jgi:hypothetical protein